MKYPKLYVGDIITIDEVAYMVFTGINPELKYTKLAPRLKYNVALRSVVYNPERFPEYIYCKNTEMKPFKKVQ
ncbi:MAG TPA: hypothetical protein VN698_16435 [Bacteroidia bacterium]|nr:hypothetical protein [Bacteroidia bacterium]